jgi:hypothetical protein
MQSPNTNPNPKSQIPQLVGNKDMQTCQHKKCGNNRKCGKVSERGLFYCCEHKDAHTDEEGMESIKKRHM